MAKSANAAKAVAPETPVADTESEDLLKKAKAAADHKAKLQAELKKVNTDLKKLQEEADEALKSVAGPLIEVVKAARAEVETMKEARKATVEARKTEDAAYKESLAELDKRIEDAIAEAVALGIPEGMVRGTRKRTSTAKSSDKGSRKNLKLAELGPVGPVVVEAIRRTGDGTVKCAVMYEVAQSGDGSFEVYAKRVDDGKGNISDEKMAAGYTHIQNNLSKVTTSPGWHETADVQYALLHACGKLDEFPSARPTNPASSITVGGESVPEPTNIVEVVEDETV